MTAMERPSFLNIVELKESLLRDLIKCVNQLKEEQRIERRWKKSVEDIYLSRIPTRRNWQYKDFQQELRELRMKTVVTVTSICNMIRTLEAFFVDDTALQDTLIKPIKRVVREFVVPHNKMFQGEKLTTAVSVIEVVHHVGMLILPDDIMIWLGFEVDSEKD